MANISTQGRGPNIGGKYSFPSVVGICGVDDDALGGQQMAAGQFLPTTEIEKKMKFIIAGDWHSDLHEEAVFNALRQLDQDVVRFPWHYYFKPARGPRWLASLLLRFQNKYKFGPVVDRLNRDLVNLVNHENPDVVFCYRGSHIYPETLQRLKKNDPNLVLIGYNNDDPFSPLYPRWMWRHFLGGLPEYDLAFAYRHQNLDEFTTAGARRVELLRSWYIPERNRLVDLNENERIDYGCDVVFIGHYEDDGRLQCLEEIVRRGWKLNLFGSDFDWHPVLRKTPLLESFLPIRTVWGEEYNRAICGAKVALCFLSKLNRDTYTRRCFEIPATGTLMLAEYTDDLAGLFEAGKEADFFNTSEDLMGKLDFYLSEDEIRRQVGISGRQRVITDGHDVVSRMRQLLSWIQDLRSKDKLN
jgi:spore maturation protein CgeB